MLVSAHHCMRESAAALTFFHPTESDESGGGADDLVAGSSYLDMLTDERRNRAYRSALDLVLQPEHVHVLDIGEECVMSTGGIVILIMTNPLLRHRHGPSCNDGSESSLEEEGASGPRPLQRHCLRAVPSDGGTGTAHRCGQWAGILH